MNIMELETLWKELVMEIMMYKFTIKGNKSLDDINEFIMKHFAKYQQPIVCKI